MKYREFRYSEEVVYRLVRKHVYKKHWNALGEEYWVGLTGADVYEVLEFGTVERQENNYAGKYITITHRSSRAFISGHTVELQALQTGPFGPQWAITHSPEDYWLPPPGLPEIIDGEVP